MENKEISVLLVGDRYVYTGEIEKMLRHTRWRIAKASSIAEAKKILAEQPLQVLLCQQRLQNGSWVNLVRAAQQLQAHAPIVVLCKADDAVIADLRLGAYDILPVPCSAPDLYTTVAEAWRHCMQQEHASAASSVA